MRFCNGGWGACTGRAFVQRLARATASLGPVDPAPQRAVSNPHPCPQSSSSEELSTSDSGGSLSATEALSVGEQCISPFGSTAVWRKYHARYNDDTASAAAFLHQCRPFCEETYSPFGLMLSVWGYFLCLLCGTDYKLFGRLARRPRVFAMVIAALGALGALQAPKKFMYPKFMPFFWPRP